MCSVLPPPGSYSPRRPPHVRDGEMAQIGCEIGADVPPAWCPVCLRTQELRLSSKDTTISFWSPLQHGQHSCFY